MLNEQDDWKTLNQQGLFPGPEESKEEFIKRANFCQNLLAELSQRVDQPLPFDFTDTATNHVTHEAMHFSNKIFGITPDWIPIFFSNYKLSSWHGGCAWIFQLDERTPTSAFIQLRKNFKTKSWYLGIYSRKELITHELAHVGRMLYQEPKFEEVLAYRSADSKWRRFFGPLIQSSKESLFFIILLAVVLLISLASLSADAPLISSLSLGIFILPFFIALLAFLRLTNRQWQFENCLKNLEKIYKHPQLANHLIYRLTDKEILLFAKMNSSEISPYIEAQSLVSFRWQFLYANYSSSL